jgi:FAD/FMN-containing dehydrogenase
VIAPGVTSEGMEEGHAPEVARPAGAAETARKAALAEQVRRLPAGERARLVKRTSNLFRTRTKRPAAGLDMSGFDQVLGIDVATRRARVGGMTTYERLVDATLAHGLMPLVVPQLKTITLGGAVAGLGIESSSFRNGLPHESVGEMEVLTGTGDVVVARPQGEHRDLFFGFPNSYGALGYALTLDIELEPVRDHVRLRRLRYDDSGRLFADLAQICRSAAWQDERVDFVDGAVFDGGDMHLTLGQFVDDAPYTSDYTWLDMYYRSCQTRDEDFLTARDYLWRWDTDWFWCSSALGLDRRWLRRLVGRRRMRSDNYFKVVAFERRHQLTNRWDRLRGRPAREVVVQDVEIPIERAADFVEFMLKDVGALPIWLCPFRQRDDSVTWDLCPSGSGGGWYVNLGFWTRVALTASSPPDGYNRLIERTVGELGGFKSLYSTCFYAEDEFWRIYGGDAFDALKRRYDPDGRFPDLYEKCVRGA